MIRSQRKIHAQNAVFVGLFLGATISSAHAQSRPPRAIVTEIKPRADTLDTQAIRLVSRKLASIVIPSIEFRQTTLSDAVEFLRQESRRLDPDPDVQARGVNIILKVPVAGGADATRPVALSADPTAAVLPPGADPNTGAAVPAVRPPSPANVHITLALSRIPLDVALKYVASQAGLKVKIEPYAVSLVPLTEETDVLNTAIFRVPPDFISNVTTGRGANPLDQGATAAH